MVAVKSVLRRIDGAPASASMDEVRKLIRTGHRFRYEFRSPYTANLPEVTATRRAGDCKDKALWLASQLNDASVRFVIGKARRNSNISHAWLYWKDGNDRWWILDCTNRSAPLPADRAARDTYIPLYSYGADGAYLHGSAARLANAQSGSHPAVAGNR